MSEGQGQRIEPRRHEEHREEQEGDVCRWLKGVSENECRVLPYLTPQPPLQCLARG